jgi:hypothetical protein
MAEIIPAEGETLRSEIHKLINFICKRERIALAVRAVHYSTGDVTAAIIDSQCFPAAYRITGSL